MSSRHARWTRQGHRLAWVMFSQLMSRARPDADPAGPIREPQATISPSRVNQQVKGVHHAVHHSPGTSPRGEIVPDDAVPAPWTTWPADVDERDGSHDLTEEALMNFPTHDGRARGARATDLSPKLIRPRDLPRTPPLPNCPPVLRLADPPESRPEYSQTSGANSGRSLIELQQLARPCRDTGFPAPGPADRRCVPMTRGTPTAHSSDCEPQTSRRMRRFPVPRAQGGTGILSA